MNITNLELVFEHTKGLPEAAEKEGLTPLRYMKKYWKCTRQKRCKDDKDKWMVLLTDKKDID